MALDDAVFFLKKYDRQCFEEIIDGLDEIIWDFLQVPTDEEVAERRGREPRGYTVEEWVAAAQRQRGELEYD